MATAGVTISQSNDADWANSGGYVFDNNGNLVGTSGRVPDSFGAGAASSSAQWTGEAGSAYGNARTYSQPVNPWAAWGGKAAYDSKINSYNQLKDTTINTANENIGQYGQTYGQGIAEYLFGRKQGQQGIDQKGTNIELAKMQGSNSILGSVGRNIRSAGVMLANKNAGDSSAAQALANAYGEQGKRQMSQVGQQYAQGNQSLAQEQMSFEEQQALAANRLRLGKDQFVNDLANKTRDQLAAIDAQIAGESLPNRIAFEQEKQAIRQRAIDQLQAYDNNLNSGISGLQAKNVDQRREAAGGLLRAGTDLGADAFNYTVDQPAQFQGTGPSASELPLFSLPRGRRLG